MLPASISGGRAGGGERPSACVSKGLGVGAGLAPRAPEGMNTISDLAHLNKRSPLHPCHTHPLPTLSEWPLKPAGPTAVGDYVCQFDDAATDISGIRCVRPAYHFVSGTTGYHVPGVGGRKGDCSPEKCLHLPKVTQL